MSNKELFRQTFSELHASEDKVMEVINMKCNRKTKHFHSKRLIAVAACVGTILIAGVVANAATDGAIVDSFITVITQNGEEKEIPAEVSYDNDGRKTQTIEYGNKVVTVEELESGGSGYTFTQKDPDKTHDSITIVHRFENGGAMYISGS
ncbi:MULTISPECIES: hypothetical protein [unclassified Ruminococcus]|uniref:hypothetical protein n=1 Tax=unclassified Ruminococcus TaxID=2608920 RepID=UPI00210B49A5|nr:MULTISPECIES: hypothetical protein [unclassified Ruminococcus]MCQ4021946.1 hypothetical protein [Ruminococcus sp. zg-924]MCQ4114482.1 hypothetical protein [Ruminococcus sp. zg-921]